MRRCFVFFLCILGTALAICQIVIFGYQLNNGASKEFIWFSLGQIILCTLLAVFDWMKFAEVM